MKGEIELYNISFLILKVELHFKSIGPLVASDQTTISSPLQFAQQLTVIFSERELGCQRSATGLALKEGGTLASTESSC